MKTIALTLSILCAWCAFAFAGPESLPSGKEMKEVVQPLPPACPTWTGFYIGGFGGYKFANVDIDLELDGAWDTVFPTGRDLVEPRGSHDFDISGAEAGGLIGYNYQWHNWVFGAEAAGGYLWLRDYHESGDFAIPNDVSIYNIRTSFKSHYLFTLGPRIGYTFCRWMPYVTGGLAVGDLDFDQVFRNSGSAVFSFRDKGDTSETNAGWMVGGGLEYAITIHWRIRGQYQYIDLGDVDFHTAGTGVLPVTPAADFTGHHEASLQEHNASVALIFGF